MYLRRYRTAIKPPSSWLGTTKCVCGNWFSSQNIAAIGRCRNKYLSGTRAKIAKRINAPIHLAFYYLPNLEIELRLATDDLCYLPWICVCQLIWKLPIRNAILGSGSPAGVKDAQ